VREGGLPALLNYLPFFSTSVQRVALATAANCCRSISADQFPQVRDVFPILRENLAIPDQRLVEQATLAVVRTLEAYRHKAEHLEGLLDAPTISAINDLLMPSGGSPLLSQSTYTALLKCLTSSARRSATVTLAFLDAGLSSTIYQILTGVLPSTHGSDEQGAAADGQGLGGGVADMAVLQNLAHRPKDQVEEALSLVCELLPPHPRDGVFDMKSYTEKSLSRIKRGQPVSSQISSRRSSRRNSMQAEDPSGSTATPTSLVDNNSMPPVAGGSLSVTAGDQAPHERLKPIRDISATLRMEQEARWKEQEALL
jgi:E3 ubiquitin-protein ligase TRIP12